MRRLSRRRERGQRRGAAALLAAAAVVVVLVAVEGSSRAWLPSSSQPPSRPSGWRHHQQQHQHQHQVCTLCVSNSLDNASLCLPVEMFYEDSRFLYPNKYEGFTTTDKHPWTNGQTFVKAFHMFSERGQMVIRPIDPHFPIIRNSIEPSVRETRPDTRNPTRPMRRGAAR